jgi:cellulose synthase/poly-beta-1,6-N-acetylglucosamine synthase-like glycosyltransferase
MISIIITAFKEPNTIGRAIESFAKQKIRDKYELIVAAPDDETLNVAKNYSKKYKQVKILKDPGNGKPSALNLIIKKAKGSILILSDGDVFVEENSVNLLLSHFKDKLVGAVSGHPIPMNSRSEKFGYWAHLLTFMAHSLRKNSKFSSCSGYLYAARKELLQEMPADTLSDDAYNTYILKEKGYKIDYEENAIVYVKYPNNFGDWIKQKKRSAGGYNQIKYLFKKDVDRGLVQESSGILEVLKYPKNIKEFLWTVELIFARIYLWSAIFITINLRKQEFKKVWVRVESTK